MARNRYPLLLLLASALACDSEASPTGDVMDAPAPAAGGKADSLDAEDWENWTVGQRERLDRMKVAFAETLPRLEYGSDTPAMRIRSTSDLSNVNQYPELDGFEWVHASVSLEARVPEGDDYRLLFIKDEGEEGIGLRLFTAELIKGKYREVDGADPWSVYNTFEKLATAVFKANHYYTPTGGVKIERLGAEENWSTGLIGRMRYETVDHFRLTFGEETVVYEAWFERNLERLLLFKTVEPQTD